MRPWLAPLLWLPLALAGSGCGAGTEAAVPSLVSARLLQDDAPTPPPDDAPGWREVTLPDTWGPGSGRGGFAWYRFGLEGLGSGEGPVAVHVAFANTTAGVWLNGQPIGLAGRFREPVSHDFNRPLYFVLPASLLEPRVNTLDVRLFSYRHGYGGLGPIQVGPDALLRPAHARRHLLQVRLAELSSVVALLMTLFVGSLWIGSRGDGSYGYFAAATLLWGVNGLNYWVREIPVPHWTWERIVHAPLEGFAVMLAIWAHRRVGVERPRLERALWGFLAAGLVLTWTLPPKHFYPVVNVFHASSVGIGAYAVWTLIQRLGSLPRREAATYVVGGVACVAFALNDLSIQLGLRPAGSPALLVYVIPFMMVAFGSTLVGRFVASLSQAQQLGRELEQRVAEKHAELEENYRRLQDLERERLIAAERERLMREVHDGLGGQLVSTLSMVEGGRGSSEDVAAALRAALDDMRLVIDSLDPHVGGLEELLGMLRSRLDPLLRRNGLRFDWRVGSLPQTPRFGPEEYLNVLRIVQEAVTNVIKHAGASTIRVESRVEAQSPPSVRIEIRDDGRGGGGGGGPAGGRGVENMRRRAEALGGNVEVEQTDEGTAVVLRLPLDEPTAR